MHMKSMKSRTAWSVAVMAAGLLCMAVPSAHPGPDEAGAAKKFIDRVGDDSLKYFADSIEESYPFGRSNKARDEEISKAGGMETTSTDWKLSNRHYLFDGDWYAVQWFYGATTIKTGKKQLECTLAFGKVQDGKLVVWAEYFDDLVGELQQEGKLPLYEPDEAPFPWPAAATLKHPYRP